MDLTQQINRLSRAANTRQLIQGPVLTKYLMPISGDAEITTFLPSVSNRVCLTAYGGAPCMHISLQNPLLIMLENI